MAALKPFKTEFKLTVKEFAFADAILRGLGNIQAVKEAGYNCKSDNALAVQAQRLLNNANVDAYLKSETELKHLERRRKTEVDDLWITEQFKEVYNRCMQAVPVMRYDRELKMEVQETDADGEGVWTFDSAGANKALENLAKHIGYYELDNKQRAPIIKIGAVQNVANFFFESNDDRSAISDKQE